MTKVITYGTYDLLHEGHIRLLERAKALGDYLIVGVTSDSFDRARGKINVQQTLLDRVEGIKSTGLADQIIIEEYEGQKIDDIKKYGIDIFTVGSDWQGKFDYLNEYCEVVYLDRTQGISSSKIRSGNKHVRIGIVGETNVANKFFKESKYVNGVVISGIFAQSFETLDEEIATLKFNSFEDLVNSSDALYVASVPELHYTHIKKALESGLHVMCESPVCTNPEQLCELMDMAKDKGLVLMDCIKTAYSLAFSRLSLIVKGGIIGDIVAVDATCTSLLSDIKPYSWNSISWWGPTAILAITTILGVNYNNVLLSSRYSGSVCGFDEFTQGVFFYPHSVATFKVGQGVKSEGELVISGTKGYIYVPAPWWKTDYFEVRYENQSENRRYFYQLDGEGIRQEIKIFSQMITGDIVGCHVSQAQSEAIVKIVSDVMDGNVTKL